MSAVLATLSGSYPPLEGRSPTCYSAVRHCPRPERREPFDLHVLGTPPAFILSQDQTLHRNCPRSILPYRTNGFLKRSLNRSSRSPPLFDCQRAPRDLSLVRSPTFWRGRTSYQAALAAVKTFSSPKRCPKTFRPALIQR